MVKQVGRAEKVYNKQKRLIVAALSSDFRALAPRSF